MLVIPEGQQGRTHPQIGLAAELFDWVIDSLVPGGLGLPGLGCECPLLASLPDLRGGRRGGGASPDVHVPRLPLDP